jgi:hypothetical protein
MPILEIGWLCGDDLLERWEMESWELYQAIRYQNLPVFDRNTKAIYDLPYALQKIVYDCLLSPDPFKPISNPDTIELFSLYYNTLLFDKSDVEKFETVYSSEYDDILQNQEYGGCLKGFKLRFMTIPRLIKRWGISLRDLYLLIKKYDLRIYDSKLTEWDDLTLGFHLVEDWENLFFLWTENVYEIENSIGFEQKPSKLKNKSNPNQNARLKCRDIAKKLWSDKPHLTIAAMIDREEIVNASTKTGGKLYTEKTVRNWIKDLCPDRSPGRPKKQKH